MKLLIRSDKNKSFDNKIEIHLKYGVQQVDVITVLIILIPNYC